MRETLEKLRVPYATGRVELKVKRSDCYGGARKAFAKLAPKAWRMSWFLKFDGESGLDAGGLSRDFWRLCLAKAFDEPMACSDRLMREIPRMMLLECEASRTKTSARGSY